MHKCDCGSRQWTLMPADDLADGAWILSCGNGHQWYATPGSRIDITLPEGGDDA